MASHPSEVPLPYCSPYRAPYCSVPRVLSRLVQPPTTRRGFRKCSRSKQSRPKIASSENSYLRPAVRRASWLDSVRQTAEGLLNRRGSPPPPVLTGRVSSLSPY